MNQIVLSAKNIHKSYDYPIKNQILNDLCLDVEKGSSVAIVGRSGEGKSTLLHVLGTLEKPCSGELVICGEKVNSFNVNKVRNQNIAFIFQSFHLLEDYTVLENILMPAKIARKNTSPGSTLYTNAMNLLEKVGLQARADFSTKLLSGGEKQRVAILRALCNDPEIIYADEPSGNLDKVTAKDIHQLLLDFTKEKGKTLIAVTHDPDFACLCEKRYELKKGELIQL